MSNLKETANKFNININVSLVEDVFVKGNKIALTELVINLISNAIQYTGENGTVSVVVDKKDDGKILLSVSDNGGGILPEDLPHIFKPFYRGKVKNVKTYQQGNTGLGLYIVKEIASLHNATISVESGSNGSKFNILFKVFQKV